MPKAAYTLQQLRPALEAYGLGDTGVEFVAGGGFAEVYRLVGVDEPLLLRIRAPEAHPDEVRFAHLWAATIAPDVPAPQGVRPERDIPRIDHRCVEIITYIEHDLRGDVDAGPDAWERVGDWMGRMHRLADKVAAQAPVDLDYGNHPHDRLLRRCLEQARIGCLDDDHRQLLKRVDSLYERVQAITEPHLPRLPVGVVHGDLHFWNILYTAGMPVGVIDLDFLQRGILLHDLAYAGHWLAAWEGRGGPWAGITERYIAAYAGGRDRPLCDEERICLPWLRVLSNLYFFVSKVCLSWRRLALAYVDLTEAEALAAELSANQ